MHLYSLVLPNPHKLLILNPQFLNLILNSLKLFHSSLLTRLQVVHLLLGLLHLLMQLLITLYKRLRHHGHNRHLLLVFSDLVQGVGEFFFWVKILHHLPRGHGILVAARILCRNLLLDQRLEVVHVDFGGAAVKVQHLFL